MRTAYIVEFIAMFGVWLAVVVTYHFMTGGRWRHSPEGRHVMIFGLCFVWVTGLVLTNVAFRNYSGRAVVGLVSYGSFVLIGLQRLVMIVRAQRARRALARSAAQAELLNKP
jgi:hypothetical protein